jgi:ATP-dependent DNA ligase
MATDCKTSSPLSPNCGVPLELPVAVRSKPIAQLARYIARVLPARGRGLAHEIKYDGFRSARGSGYLAYGLIARKPGGSLSFPKIQSGGIRAMRENSASS